VFAFGGFAAALALLGGTRRERRARSRAEAAVRLRDEVVSIVSHDLRNPLNTIQIATASLLKTVPEIEDRRAARKQLEIIDRASESMTRIIADLLDVARIESEGLALERTTLGVPALLDDAASSLRPIVEAHGQEFVCRWSPELPAIRGDRERLLQV
jgi:two-component system phosphate regulon sensor histidine kinase PhoR